MAPNSRMLSNPRTRAEEYFKAANNRLLKAIPKSAHSHLSSISFPDFDTINGVEAKAAALEHSLEILLALGRSTTRTLIGHKR